MDQEDSKRPSARNVRNICAALLAVGLTIFHIATGGLGQLPDMLQRAFHLGGATALAFMILPAAGETSRYRFMRAIDWLLMATALGGVVYIFLRYDAMMELDYWASRADIVAGTIFTLVLLEAGRRVVGWFFPCLAIAMIAYALFGHHISGVLGHAGMGWFRITEVLFTTQRGLWGVVTGISATVIAIFVIFGAVMFAAGGGKTFMDLSMWMSGRSVGGAAKVATVASGLFGSISGSAAANIATTGAFTIPMMKRLGYAPSFAAAVEASASTGGQIMPPIMGAGAFVMAELMGVPYFSIAVAALIPALLFYVSVFFGVHLMSKRMGYLGMASEDIPRPRAFMAPSRSLPLFVPLGAVIYLLVAGYTPSLAGFAGATLSIVLFLILNVVGKGLIPCLRILIDSFVVGGRGLVTVAVLIGCAQIVLALIASTGLGLKISEFVIALGGTSLTLSLIMAMMLAIVLGMGLPTTAAYLLAAAILAPALSQLGISLLQAHMFIFYYATISVITPPVCPGIFIACGMAGGRLLDAASYAVRLAFVAMVAPFLFIEHGELLMIGEPWMIALRTVQGVVFAALSSMGLMGYVRGEVGWVWRVILIVCGVLVILPYDIPAICGAVVGILSILWLFHSGRKAGSVLVQEQPVARSKRSCEPI